MSRPVPVSPPSSQSSQSLSSSCSSRSRGRSPAKKHPPNHAVASATPAAAPLQQQRRPHNRPSYTQRPSSPVLVQHSLPRRSSSRKRRPPPTNTHSRSQPAVPAAVPAAATTTTNTSRPRRSSSRGRRTQAVSSRSREKQQHKHRTHHHLKSKHHHNHHTRTTKSDDDDSGCHHHLCQHHHPQNASTATDQHSMVSGCVDSGTVLKDRLAQCFFLTTDLVYREESVPEKPSRRRDDNELFFLSRTISFPQGGDDIGTVADRDHNNNHHQDLLSGPPPIINTMRADTGDEQPTLLYPNHNTTLGRFETAPPSDVPSDERIRVLWPHHHQHQDPNSSRFDPDMDGPIDLALRQHQPSLSARRRDRSRRPRGSYDDALQQHYNNNNNNNNNNTSSLNNSLVDMDHTTGNTPLHHTSSATTPHPVDEPTTTITMMLPVTDDQDEPLAKRIGIANQSPQLRNTRLHLFEQDIRNTDKNATAVKYSRALEDLAAQDETMRRLQMRLNESQQELQRMQQELAQAKAVSHTHQLASAQSSAKIFQDRVGVEERLRKELKFNSELQNRVNEMELEKERLVAELAEAKQEAVEVRAWTPDRKSKGSPGGTPQGTPQSTPKCNRTVVGDPSSPFRAEILGLRTELVELKAQVAEAHAARISAAMERGDLTRELEAVQEQEKQLRIKLETVGKELAHFKTKVQVSERDSDKEHSRLKEELDKMRILLEKSGNEVAEHVEKSNRLEKELSETKKETTRLRSEHAETLKELERTKREADNRVNVSEEEAKKLQVELRMVKDKLSQTNAEIIQQATAHLKQKEELKEDLWQSRQVAEKLQYRIQQMDDQVVEAESEAERHRLLLVASAQDDETRSNVSSGIKRLSGDVFQLLKKRLDSMDTHSEAAVNF